MRVWDRTIGTQLNLYCDVVSLYSIIGSFIVDLIDYLLAMFHACFSIASVGNRADASPPFIQCMHEHVSRSGPDLISRIAHQSHAYSSFLSPGSPVVIVGKTSVSFVETLFAIMDSGCIAVPINIRWSGKEVAHALSLVQPSLIIADSAHYALMASIMDNLSPSPFPSPSSSWSSSCQLIRLKEGHQAEEPTENRHQMAISPPLQLKSPSNGAALIIFTSGTSSSPKAVLLSHANLHYQSLAKLTQPPAVGFDTNDTYLHLAPLFHIGGVSSLLASLMGGARQVLMPSFDPLLALVLIREERVTSFIAVPTIIQDLIRAARSSQLDGVRKILVGAGGLSQMTKKAIVHTFPRARLCTAYGMSEACSSITCNELHHPSRLMPSVKGSCVGRPAPGIEIKIDDPWKKQNEEEDSTSEIDDPGFKYGEILTRGPHVMLGYYNDPEATSQAISTERWLRTGDLGYIDQLGSLWLLGRAKDVVKSGGENVFASEVEEALMKCPMVTHAAVVGLSDERLGERVAALVVLKAGIKWEGPIIASPSSSSSSSSRNQLGLEQHSLTPLQLKEQCRAGGLSGFKLPRLIAAQYHPLPINTSGKVLKRIIKAQLESLELQSRL